MCMYCRSFCSLVGPLFACPYCAVFVLCVLSVCVCVSVWEREREGERDRQTDRQRQRQTETERGRETEGDRETEKKETQREQRRTDRQTQGEIWGKSTTCFFSDWIFVFFVLVNMFLGSRISHPLSPTASPWNHSITNARGELTATTYGWIDGWTVGRTYK